MLRLPFRQHAWKGAAGNFSGSASGTSMDFMDQRVYAPGDDPRHINWQAYARTGNYTMKVFREEVRPVVDLIIDVSPSMFLPEKKPRVLELVKFLVDSSTSAGVAVHAYLVFGEKYRNVDTHELLGDTWCQQTREGTQAHPELNTIPLRSNSIRVLISDLLFEAEPQSIIQALSRASGKTIIFSPFASNESAPNWSGNHDFQEIETAEIRKQQVSPSLLKNYIGAYRQHFSHWKQIADRSKIPLARIPCEGDLMKILYQHALPIQALETTQ